MSPVLVLGFPFGFPVLGFYFILQVSIGTTPIAITAEQAVTARAAAGSDLRFLLGQSQSNGQVLRHGHWFGSSISIGALPPYLLRTQVSLEN